MPQKRRQDVPHEHEGARISPDGTQVLTADYNTAYVYDAKTGKELFALNTNANGVVFLSGDIH